MKYIPNQIPFGKRIRNTIFSIVLVIYGGFGLYINDLYLPGRDGGVHLHDESAFIMYGAFICGVLVMLSVLLDHYDKRNNERKYQLFAKIFEYLGWGLFINAFIINAVYG